MHIKKKFLVTIPFFLLPTLLLLFLAYSYSSPHPEELIDVKKWFILLDYDSSHTEIETADILNYDMAVVDPDSHPSFENLEDKLILIAYVSIGEAETYRPYWEGIKDKPWVIDENPNWEGNYYVDVRYEEWRFLIINELIPKIIKSGFKGIMMDTLDTASDLEESEPHKYKGSKAAMVDFVKAIHQKYPHLLLISNNGFSILSDIAPYLSGALVEDINMMVDFKKNGYKKVPAEEKRYKISILKKIIDKYRLPVFVIDYVSQEKKGLIKRYVKENRRLGFKPYIAEKNLNAIYDN